MTIVYNVCFIIIEQLINLSHSVIASNTDLEQISKFLHNLFTVRNYPKHFFFLIKRQTLL